jgi:hypothetical protein
MFSYPKFTGVEWCKDIDDKVDIVVTYNPVAM